MKRKHNMLNYKLTFKLYKYLENRAVDGKIDLRPGALAKEANIALDFKVTAANITNAARNLEIELIKNKPVNGAASPEDDNVAVFAAKLTAIEQKVDDILRHLTRPELI